MPLRASRNVKFCVAVGVLCAGDGHRIRTNTDLPRRGRETSLAESAQSSTPESAVGSSASSWISLASLLMLTSPSAEAFALGGSRVGLLPVARAPASRMEETTLNNYKLPGPLNLLGENIMVKRTDKNEGTKGGLLLAAESQVKSKECIVVAAGPGRKSPETGELIPVPVKAGEKLLLKDYVGEEIQYNNEEHVLVQPDSLLASFGDKDFAIANIQPVSDHVVLEVQKAEQEETASGLYVALLQDDSSKVGKVVAVGPGKTAETGKAMPPTLAVGDSVYYAQDKSSNVKIGDKDYIIVSEGDCFVKF